LKKDDRYYEKSREFWNTAGVALVFTILVLISIVFIIFDIPFMGFKYWGFWFGIPAFFLWIASVNQYMQNKRFKKTVESVLNSYKELNDRISLDKLSSETMISQNILLRVLMDLRSEGRLKYIYDKKTGDIIINPKKLEDQKIEVSEEKSENPYYCPYCGEPISRNDKFCFKCGSSTD